VLRIVQSLPVPDLPKVARSSRALSRIVRDERGWEWRCKVLDIAAEASRAAQPPTLPRKLLRTSIADDDFGDFSSTNDTFEDVDFGDFNTSKPNGRKADGDLLDFDDLPLPSHPFSAGSHRTTGFFALTPTPTALPPGLFMRTYKAHHLALVPLCRHLRSSPSPSSTLSLIFPNGAPTSLPEQANLLFSLLLFLSAQLQPLYDWGFLRQALLAATDRFDSTCLVAFEVADSKGDATAMRSAAESSWKVWDAGGGTRDQWECGRVWVEKREVFYENGKWDPLENLLYVLLPLHG